MRRCLFLLVLVFTFLVVFAPTGSAAANEEQVYVIAQLSGQSENYAEISLQQLAARDRRSRIIGGSIVMATGGGLMLLGATTDDALGSGFLMITGGAVAVTGAIVLLIKHDSEKEYAQVMRIDDDTEREVAAYESLDYLAAKAKRSRIIGGVTCTGLAVLSLMDYFQQDIGEVDNDGDLYTALIYAGTAAYDFIVPSHEENVFKNVTRQKGLNVGFKFGEVNGVVLSLNF